MVRRVQGWMVMLAVLLGASSAWAIDPAIKCQSDKLRLAAKYVACRLNVEANAARNFDVPDFTSCSSDYLAGWKKAEARAVTKGTTCWTTNDSDVVKGGLDAQLSSLADWLAGSGAN